MHLNIIYVDVPVTLDETKQMPSKVNNRTFYPGSQSSLNLKTVIHQNRVTCDLLLKSYKKA